jgi:hypothetical protein
MRRLASVFRVVFYSIPTFIYATFAALWRHPDDWRRKAWRRFSSVIFSDILRFTCTKYCVFWRRRHARRLFASVVSCGFPGVMNFASASRRQALRRLALFCQRLVLWLPSDHVYGILGRRRDRQRCASVMSCGFLRLMYIVYVILSLLCDDRRCDARRRFASVLSCAFTKLMYAIYGIFLSAS